MAVVTTAMPIILTRYASNSDTNEYQAPSNTKTIIDKFTGTNVSAGAVTLSIHLVTSTNSAGSEYLIIKEKSLAADETIDFTDIKGHVLDSGDFISVVASAADSIVIRASGRQVVTS